MFDPRTVTDAVVAMLRERAGRPIGDAQVPDDTTVPYAFVSPSGIASVAGPLGAPRDDLVLRYRLTSVGANRQQVEAMASRLFRLMVELDPAGDLSAPVVDPLGEWWCADRMLEASTGVVVDVDSGLWQQTDIYLVTVTPG